MTDGPAISAATRPYAVLGHPVAHSLAPIMHNAAFGAMGLDAVFLAFEVTVDNLMATLACLRAIGFGGVTLATPLKEAAREEMALLDESARRAGEVNCVRFDDEGMRGYCTEGPGLLRALEEAGLPSLEGRVVSVIGSGGMAQSAAIACAIAGAADVVIVGRNAERCAELAVLVDGAGPGSARAVTDPAAQPGALRDSDLVLHCTPVGLSASDRPLYGPDAFRAGQWLLDMIYHVPETPLMAVARTAGATAVNGLAVRLHQGALCLEIWTQKPAPLEAMRAALHKVVYR